MLDIVESLHSVRAELELGSVRGQRVHIYINLLSPDGQKVSIDNWDLHQLDSAVHQMEEDYKHD